MYEQTVIVGEFSSEAAAQVALARLRLDRIRAVIVGNVPCATTFTLLGRFPWAPIQIAVAKSEADRARFILDAAGLEVLAPDWESLAECAIDGWLCPLCDSEVSGDREVCPDCGSDPDDLPW